MTLARTCTVALVAAWTATAAAMSTPNPAGRWSAHRFFLAGDFQYNDSKDLDPAGSVDDMAGFFIRPGYSIADNVMLYGRLGFQTAKDVDTGFAGGFGLQGAYVLPQATAWAIGGAFDYLHWSGDLQPHGPSIAWDEFQLTPAVSYTVRGEPRLTPYGGLLFDFVDGRGSLSESDPVGLLFGTNFDPTRHVRLDAQVRLVSETGFFLSVGYLF